MKNSTVAPPLRTPPLYRLHHYHPSQPSHSVHIYTESGKTALKALHAIVAEVVADTAKEIYFLLLTRFAHREGQSTIMCHKSIWGKWR